MRSVERVMDEPSQGAIVGLVSEHVAVMGKVAMALLGDSAEAERVLEDVARQVGAAKELPARPLAWLLGLVRVASAARLSKLPLRTRTSMPRDEGPATERLGAADAVPARVLLGSLKPTEREAVILAFVGGLDTADVAIACNIDVTTAKARLARGVEILMKAEGSPR